MAETGTFDPYQLISEEEAFAQEATRLRAFQGINLQGTKRIVGDCLQHFGRSGFFGEYTPHDISHVNEMLRMLNWLVPHQTREAMSPADWLLTVLSFYFHDLGLIITDNEFDRRKESGFDQFVEELLNRFEGTEYSAKLMSMNVPDRERFLYQEFVRTHHATRIRLWLDGTPSSRFGVADELIHQVNTALGSLPPNIRRDLGIICESHHLDDLDDLAKYKILQPYRNSDAETANLHFCALLLRTTDLLHISEDRAPSVAFSLIDPKDPFSQEEWWKQHAVKRVRDQVARDRDGRPDESLPRNTIEVRADFERTDGFFGLTSYLSYAAGQVETAFHWAQLAKGSGAKHSFPWRYIDQENIETHGFIKKPFSFTFAQDRILDLLTGHTLYNDSSVVMRELVQNSLDAVRFERHNRRKKDPKDPYYGRIHISYSSAAHELTIEDDGTGMTQEVIEKHFLRVGSSFYQEDRFKEEYSDYSPISRFGIGVLTAFMVSDEVEVITCSPKEPEARQISLRSVHGKYLIKLLNKESDDVPERIKAHGTTIKLKLRSTARFPDLNEVLRRWIVLPLCDVFFSVDDSSPQRIGYLSLVDALKAELEENGIDFTDGGGDDGVQVRHYSRDGLEIVYAVSWSRYFKYWSFLRTSARNHGKNMLGISVEGVRVTQGTPGFKGARFYAMANLSGIEAPKTNVARSGLERSFASDESLRRIFQAYFDHIRGEIREMVDSRCASLSYAVDQVEWMTGDVSDKDEQNSDAPQLLRLEQLKVPSLLIHIADKTEAASPAELIELEEFYTIACNTFQTAASLLRHINTKTSVLGLLQRLDNAIAIPKGVIVVEPTYFIQSFHDALEEKQISEIQYFESDRRVDLKWSRVVGDRLWIELASSKLARTVRTTVLIAVNDIDQRGCSDVSIISTNMFTLVLPGTEIGSATLELLNAFKATDTDVLHPVLAVLISRAGRESAPGVSARTLLTSELGLSLDDPVVSSFLDVLNALKSTEIVDLSLYSRSRERSISDFFS